MSSLTISLVLHIDSSLDWVQVNAGQVSRVVAAESDAVPSRAARARRGARGTAADASGERDAGSRGSRRALRSSRHDDA